MYSQICSVLTPILMTPRKMRDRGVQHQMEWILRWVRNVAGGVGNLVEACYYAGLLMMMNCHQMTCDKEKKKDIIMFPNT